MSSAFTQFLRDLAVKESAKSKEGEAMLAEWRPALERLFGKIRSWLAESDPDGIIKIKESEEELKEDGMGRYRVPRLDLHIFGNWIGIIPKARRTIGVAQPPMRSVPERATGRVDITDESRRYVLYRFSKEGEEDFWMIRLIGSEEEAAPFNQETLEAALKSYLR